MIDVKLELHNKEAVIKWLEEIRRGAGDARPLWIAVTPKINEFVQHEFHETSDNHKKWAVLNSKYRDRKIAEGFPPGIGVRTGVMKEGASFSAKRKYKKLSLIWELNQDNVKSKEGYPYAPVFNYGKRDGSQPARTIYKFTQFRLNSFLKLDAKSFNDGSKHANFTYNWLKNSLESWKRIGTSG